MNSWCHRLAQYDKAILQLQYGDSNKNINISEVDKNIKFDKSFSTNEENVNTFTKNLLVNPISSFYPNHSSFENNNISENKNNINFSQSNQSNQTMQSTSKYKKSEQKKYSQNISRQHWLPPRLII